MTAKVKVMDNDSKTMSQCMLQALRMVVDASVVPNDPFRNDSMDFEIKNYHYNSEEGLTDKGYYSKHKNYQPYYRQKQRY